MVPAVLSVDSQLRLHHEAMKSRLTNKLRQVAPIFLIGVSIACSASRSANSQPANSQAQLTGSQATSESPAPVMTSSVPTRNACTLKMSEAPVIHRLKLGMTTDEILALFPGSKDDSELRSASSARGPLGNSTFLITPSKYGSTSDFKDVVRLTFTMLDGHVSSFTISYNGPAWPDVDKFVEKLVSDKDLPNADQWEPYVGMESQMKTLTCADFSIRVFSGGEGGSQNYVLVEDLEAGKALKERRKKAREQASPTPAQ
jgi:hypothetical protein